MTDNKSRGNVMGRFFFNVNISIKTAKIQNPYYQMLDRMENNRNAHSFLAGMQDGNHSGKPLGRFLQS